MPLKVATVIPIQDNTPTNKIATHYNARTKTLLYLKYANTDFMLNRDQDVENSVQNRPSPYCYQKNTAITD